MKPWVYLDYENVITYITSLACANIACTLYASSRSYFTVICFCFAFVLLIFLSSERGEPNVDGFCLIISQCSYVVGNCHSTWHFKLSYYCVFHFLVYRNQFSFLRLKITIAIIITQLYLLSLSAQTRARKCVIYRSEQHNI